MSLGAWAATWAAVTIVLLLAIPLTASGVYWLLHIGEDGLNTSSRAARLAKRVGLQPAVRGHEGVVDGFDTRLEAQNNGLLLVRISRVPLTIAMRPRGALLAFSPIPTGDEVFDRTVVVDGSAPELFAVVSGDIRERVLEIAACGFR